MDQHPEWLPEDWEVVVKVRNYGKKCKYYINTSNGQRFYSKPAVLRYLKNSAKKPKPKPKKLDKINIERTAAETLPPGWIKETRTKRKRGKTRSDKFYIDPDTRRCFNSLLQVFRYLENKDSGEPEPKLNDKDHITADLQDHSQSTSAEAKGRRSVDKKADKRFTSRQSNNSELELAGGSKSDAVNNAKQKDIEDDSLAIKLPDKPQTVHRMETRAKRLRKTIEVIENKVNGSVHGDQISNSGSKFDALKKVDMPEPNYVEQREKKDDSLAIELLNKLTKVNGKKRGRGISENKRLANNKIENEVTRDQSLQPVDSKSAAATKDIDKSKGNGSDQRQEESVMHANKRKKTNSKCMSDLPRRSSNRLARVDVGPSLEVAENNDQAMISGMPEINAHANIGNYSNSNEQLTTKFQTGNKQKEHMTSSNGDHSCIEYNNNVLVEMKEDKKELDSSLNDLLKDQCIEFAIKTLTGAIPIEDVNKVGENPPVSSSMASSNNQTSASSSVLPCDDIWADPCFVFAVKTLTGEMPKEDNVSNVELSFHQAFNSLRATAKLDGGYLSNYTFSHFEAEKKLSATQQVVKDPYLPHHVVNDSLKDFVAQQP